MCGILCSVAYAVRDEELCPVCASSYQNLTELNQLLQNRGPDNFSECCIALPQEQGPEDSSISKISTIIHLSGHVLWTRGIIPEQQPYISEEGNLLFNGDIYSFGEDDCKESKSENENDGLRLFKILRNSSSHSHQNFLNSVSKLRGPYAFIYLDKIKNQLWFARDFFGRESLIGSFDKKSVLFISSVSNFVNVFEIPTSGVFCLQLQQKVLTLYPWDCHKRIEIEELTGKFVHILEKHRINFVEEKEERVSCFSTYIKTNPDLDSPLLKQFKKVSGSTDSKIQLEKICEILHKEVDEFLFHLRNSVRQRIKLKPPSCKHCTKSNSCPNSHSKISVLFSGGLDSTVLAYFAAESLSPGESLDLINVAFFQDGKDQLDNSIPDRQTGIESYRVLDEIFKPLGINLNFIPVNISKSTVAQMREERIRNLISPLNSVLDDSLGCCLWFAAQRTSPSRIVIVGSGADELLGGYGRHRSAFERGGWSELEAEMQLEIDRISVRNMGRDNRIISDHGVAPRIPFLDERLVEFISKCDVWVKCCPLFRERGLGEKILLRAAAFKLFGAKNSHIALFAKRAMQFGSRIAKLENRKEKGGDNCTRLYKRVLKC